jgi:hypothetical protein
MSQQRFIVRSALSLAVLPARLIFTGVHASPVGGLGGAGVLGAMGGPRSVDRSGQGSATAAASRD